MPARKSFPVVFLGCAHPHAAGRGNRVRCIDGVELVGAFDDDSKVAQTCAAAQKTRVLASPEAALDAARGGLVIVETWNWRAAELARLALDARVPMLLDKPGAQDLATLKALRDRARAGKSFVQVGYHMRYAP